MSGPRLSRHLRMAIDSSRWISSAFWAHVSFMSRMSLCSASGVWGSITNRYCGTAALIAIVGLHHSLLSWDCITNRYRGTASLIALQCVTHRSAVRQGCGTASLTVLNFDLSALHSIPHGTQSSKGVELLHGQRPSHHTTHLHNTQCVTGSAIRGEAIISCIEHL